MAKKYISCTYYVLGLLYALHMRELCAVGIAYFAKKKGGGEEDLIKNSTVYK